MNSGKRETGTGKRGSLGARARVGLAIGPSRLTAVEIRRRYPLPATPYPRRTWTYDLTPPTRDGSWPALDDALAKLRQELGGRRARAGVALLRPLGHTKSVSVPPVRGRELGALVQRNVRRYFAVGGDAALADARFLRRQTPAGVTSQGAQRSALAVHAPHREVESIAAALKAGGFDVDAITTASVALAEAVRALVPAARRGRVTVAVCAPDWLETVQLAGGSPVLVRPLPGTRHADAASVARQILDVAAQPVEGARSAAERRGKLLTVGCGEIDDALALALASSEVPPPAPVTAPAIRALDPAALAAFGAATAGDDLPLLLPDDVRRERRARSRRTTLRLSAVAAATVIFAGGLHLWGLHRELEAVETERRAIAPAVARASASRRDAVSVLSQLETVARLERDAPRYTEALAGLATALPDSAYLVSFAARGGSFRVGGVAKATSAVVPALEASPLFAEVALFSPVERDEESGSEQFDLTLALSGATQQSGSVKGATGRAGTSSTTNAGDVAAAARPSARREGAP